jgi:hypothetical protein
MDNKNTRSSTSLLIRDMYIKSADISSYPLEWLYLKKKNGREKESNVGEDMKKIGVLLSCS